MSYETVLLPNFSPDKTIILAKEQFLSYAYFDIQPSPVNCGTDKLRKIFGQNAQMKILIGMYLFELVKIKGDRVTFI